MSWHEYQMSKEIDRLGPSFYAIIMAAMRNADTANLIALRSAWPYVWEELQARYDAPGGYLEGERRLK